MPMNAPLPLLLRRLAAFLALLTGFAALPAFAADATLLVVSGEVRVIRAGDPPRGEARSGDELRSGDLIVTRGDGRAQLRFSDGAIVSLQPDTQFRIDDYRFDPQQQRGFFTLLRGAMRTATGAIGKRDRSDYRMRTPTATIGIRGTVYLAEETVCDPRCAPGARAGLRVSVSEGRIAVRSDAGEIEVGEGSAAEVSSPDALPRLTDQRPLLPPARLVASTSEATGSSVSASAGSSGAASAAGQASPIEERLAMAAPSTDFTRSGGMVQDDGSASLVTQAGSAALLQSSVPFAPATRRAPDGRLELVVDSIIGPSPAVPPGDGGSGDGGSGDGGSAGGGQAEPPPAETPLAAGLISTGSLRLDLRQTPLLGSLQFTAPDGQVELDPQLRMESVGLCPLIACLSRGTAVHADSGSDAYTSWGRWTNGTAAVRILGIGSDVALGPHQSIHYLVGVPTVTMPTSGSFRYELIGATSPTVSDGSMVPGSFSINAVAQFSSGEATRIGLEGNVKMGSGQFNITTNGGLGNPKDSQLTMQGATTFSGTLLTQPQAGSPRFDCGATGCTVRVDGGFYGPEAARMGLGYAILDPATPGRTISGVGVLQKR